MFVLHVLLLFTSLVVERRSALIYKASFATINTQTKRPLQSTGSAPKLMSTEVNREEELLNALTSVWSDGTLSSGGNRLKSLISFFNK